MKSSVLVLAATLALPAAAQTPPKAEPAPASAASASSAITGLKMPWNAVKDYVVRAAEKMPEADYAFKPTPEVRSFGQLVGHVADANYMFAAMALGQKAESHDIEKTKTSKADLVAALKESYAACEKVFAESDAQLATPAKLFGMETNRFGVVALLITHNWEHYGNMVTYMRMKGLVPPSSEPRHHAAAPHKK
jgi:uncharacterized damage-inducible protein DinB